MSVARTLRRERWRSATSGWLLSPPALILLLLVLAAVFAPLLSHYDPVQPDLAHKMLPPSAAHWFGTDHLGMDIFARTLYATRTDLTVSLSSVLLGIAVGAPLGALAAYRGGWVDETLMRLTEVMQAFPQILFAMAVFAALGVKLFNLVMIIAFLNVPVYLRMVRSVALPLREADFVLAARCAGTPPAVVVLRHVLLNTLVPVFSQFSISCAFAVQMVAGLSFVGLGVRPPQPEWGAMIYAGAGYVIYGKWWPAVFPGLAVFITAAALNGLGRRIRQSMGRNA